MICLCICRKDININVFWFGLRCFVNIVSVVQGKQGVLQGYHLGSNIFLLMLISSRVQPRGMQYISYFSYCLRVAYLFSRVSMVSYKGTFQRSIYFLLYSFIAGLALTQGVLKGYNLGVNIFLPV